ncbi:unnamed protein product [Ectocarpus sp. 8 AP-2014]
MVKETLDEKHCCSQAKYPKVTAFNLLRLAPPHSTPLLPHYPLAGIGCVGSRQCFTIGSFLFAEMSRGSCEKFVDRRSKREYGCPALLRLSVFALLAFCVTHTEQ